MNHHGVITPQKIFLLIAGAAFGGAAGYMISEVIIDRATYGPRKKKEIEDSGDDAELIDYDSLKEEQHLSKEHPYTKPALAELTREMDYVPAEPIYVVDPDNLPDEISGVPVETIFYYEKDNTYAYESTDMVDDPNGIFVPNVHLHFGEMSEDKDSVFVFNSDMGILYHIERLDKSYKVEVLGEPDPEAKDEKPVDKKRTQRNRRAATKKKTKKDPVDELTDDPHETDGK